MVPHSSGIWLISCEIRCVASLEKYLEYVARCVKNALIEVTQDYCETYLILDDSNDTWVRDQFYSAVLALSVFLQYTKVKSPGLVLHCTVGIGTTKTWPTCQLFCQAKTQDRKTATTLASRIPTFSQNYLYRVSSLCVNLVSYEK
jgi:hypothetical protein